MEDMTLDELDELEDWLAELGEKLDIAAAAVYRYDGGLELKLSSAALKLKFSPAAALKFSLEAGFELELSPAAAFKLRLTSAAVLLLRPLTRGLHSGSNE